MNSFQMYRKICSFGNQNQQRFFKVVTEGYQLQGCFEP